MSSVKVMLATLEETLVLKDGDTIKAEGAPNKKDSSHMIHILFHLI
jgi:hypothetical protein